MDAPFDKMPQRKVSNKVLQDQLKLESAVRFDNMNRNNMTLNREDFKTMLQDIRRTDLLHWLQEIFPDESLPEKDDHVGFLNMLRDGTMLCRLANEITPATPITKFHSNPKYEAHCRENIHLFLDACRRVGLHDVQLFTTDDVMMDNSSGQGVTTIKQRELRISLTLLALGLISNELGQCRVVLVVNEILQAEEKSRQNTIVRLSMRMSQAALAEQLASQLAAANATSSAAAHASIAEEDHTLHDSAASGAGGAGEGEGAGSGSAAGAAKGAGEGTGDGAGDGDGAGAAGGAAGGAGAGDGAAGGAGDGAGDGDGSGKGAGAGDREGTGSGIGADHNNSGLAAGEGDATSGADGADGADGANKAAAGSGSGDMDGFVPAHLMAQAEERNSRSANRSGGGFGNAGIMAPPPAKKPNTSRLTLKPKQHNSRLNLNTQDQVDAQNKSAAHDSESSHTSAKLRPVSVKLGSAQGVNRAILREDASEDSKLLELVLPSPFVVGDLISVDQEIMEVKGVMGRTLFVQRGMNDTAPAQHSAGTEVLQSKSERDDVEVEHDVNKFNQLRDRAVKEDFKDLDQMGFIELMEADGGDNSSNSATFVYIISENYFKEKHKDANGKHNDERLLAYLINRLDHIVHDNYSILYFHSGKTQHQLEFSFLAQAYSVLSREYKHNLRDVWIIHPTVWVRLAYFFCAPFMDRGLTSKVAICESLSDLYDDFEKGGLPIPKVVVACEDARKASWFGV